MSTHQHRSSPPCAVLCRAVPCCRHVDGSLASSTSVIN